MNVVHAITIGISILNVFTSVVFLRTGRRPRQAQGKSPVEAISSLINPIRVGEGGGADLPPLSHICIYVCVLELITFVTIIAN